MNNSELPVLGSFPVLGSHSRIGTFSYHPHHPGLAPERLLAVHVSDFSVQQHDPLFAASASAVRLAYDLNHVVEIEPEHIVPSMRNMITGTYPKEVWLDGSVGTLSEFILPLNPSALLMAALPRYVVRNTSSQSAFILMQVPEDAPGAENVPLTQPGERVPHAPELSFRRFCWRPDEPTLPVELLRAVSQFGTRVIIRPTRPAPALASETNPLL